MPDKITYQEFSAKVKEKYPDYKDVDDFELASKMVAKYPDYATTVDLKKKEEPVSVGGSESLASPSVATEDDKIIAEIAAPKPPSPTMKEMGGSETSKALKSSSARALGGIIGLPNFISENIDNFVLKPILKGVGYSDEEANAIAMATKAAPISGGANVIQSKQGQQELNKYASSVESTMKQYDNGIVESIYNKNYADAGAQIWKGAVQSLPYLVMTAATSGGGTAAVLTTIGTTAAAQRYGEVTDPTSEEGKTLSETGKIANSWAYGGFEAAGGLVTAGLLNTMKKAVGQIGEEAVKEIGKGFAKEAAKNFALEGSSEAMTELGQQTTDYLQGLRDNIDFKAVADAAVIGGVTGAGIAGTTATANKTAKMLAGRKVASGADVEKVNENNAKIVDLLAEKEKAVTPEAESVIDTQLSEVAKENKDIIDSNEQKAEKLSPEEIVKLKDLDDAIDSYDVRIESPSETDNPELLKQIKDKLVLDKQNLIEQSTKKQEPVVVKETKPVEIKPTEVISEPIEPRSIAEAPIVSTETKEGLKATISKDEAIGLLDKSNIEEANAEAKILEYDKSLAEKKIGRKNLTEDEIDDVIADMIKSGEYIEPTNLYEQRDKSFNDAVRYISQEVENVISQEAKSLVLNVLGIKEGQPSSLLGDALRNLGDKITKKDQSLSDRLQYAIGKAKAEKMGVDFDSVMGTESAWSDKKKKDFMSDVTKTASDVINAVKEANNTLSQQQEQPIVPPEQEEGLKQQKEVVVGGLTFDEQGDLTDNGYEKVISVLKDNIQSVADEMGVPIAPLLEHYNISRKGEYISSKTPILEVGKSTNFKDLIKTVKKIAFELMPENKDELNAAINKHSDELLKALEDGDKTFVADKTIGKVYSAIQKINESFDNYSEGLKQQQKQPIVREQQIEQLKVEENGKESSKSGDEAKRRQQETLLEKNKKADDLLAEGLSDIADLLGTKLSLTGEQRVKVKDAVRKVAKGMILKGEVKVEQLAIAIKDYFSKAGHDISDELINEALKEEQNAERIRKQDQGDVGTQKGVVEGTERKLSVGNDGKDQKTPRSQDEVKQRGFQTGSMEKRGGVFAEIAKEHPLYYNEKTENEQLKDAANWLDGKDEATIISSVTSTKKTGTIEQRVNRKILVAMYLQDKINKFVAEGKLEEADATHENLIKVTDSLAKEGTEIAQGLQAYAKFQRLTPDAVAWTVNNEIRKQNQSKFPETDLKAIESSEKEIDKMSTDISHEAVESEKLSKVIETIADKNKGLKQEKTNAEKAKEIADKLRKVKSSNWGITLAADPISSIGIGVLDGAVELTAKSIEVTGNIADSISKGIKKIKNSDWYKSLSADQKRKIERLFEVNIKKDIGVDSLSKGQLAKYLKTEIKDLKVSIKDVINKHWTDPNTMGITLSERIVSDLGLSKAEADLVEKTMSEIIRDMLDGKVVDYISGEALPKSKAQKSMFLDKMRDFLMVGKMDEKIYRDIFAQKFGLTPDITKEEVTLITNLNKAVQATKDMGVFGDIVANEFAREIDKLIPKTRLQELFGGMIGLDYANALSGATTHYVNMKSVFFNLLARPLMDVTRLEDWVAAARKGEMSQLPIMNVFNAWSDFAKAMGHGTTDFADIIKSGDLRAMHKYISEVKSIANLNVPELERHAFGKDRFKNIQFKGIDVNAANYMKYVGRALAAEDAFNYRGFEAVELASALRKKMQKQGFTNEQIKEQINKQVYGLGLSEAESKEIETQLAKEKANMASFGFKTDRFKDNRRRLELVREKLLNFDEAELTDLREVAKGNVFNDTRGGIVNSVMATMSRFANKNIFTKLVTMPHFMFFRIAGNIGDFSIDTIPAYGTLRAKGYTPTTMFATYMKHRADGMSGEKAAFNAIFGKRLSVSELPWKTAQLGDMGSYRYKQQQDRARIGNLMLLTQVAVVMGLYAIGGDDKDENGEPWFDISGGRFFDKDMYGREAKLMPPYTVKIGGWKWRYGNAPIMTFGMSVLGNYADMVKAGLPEEEISARVKLMSRSFLYSIGALTDQQLMQGFKSMFQSGLDLVKNAGAIKANDESGENKPVKTITNSFMKYMAKEQLSPLTAWLPSKNNLFQQAIQTYTGTAVESKDIPAMLAYDVGIHHFTNNKALDVLGNEVKRKPGYTGIYYEPAMIKENPKAWAMTRWLQDNNAYPANYYNRDEKYVYATPKSKGWLKDIFDEKKPSYESKTPSEDEFWQMRKLTGEMISKDLEKYKDAEYNGKKIWKIEADEKSSNGKTVMQEKVSKYVSEAKQQTRLYLFTWKELGQSDPKLFKTLYENKSLPPYETKVSVYKRDLDGSIYRDENGEFIIKDKRDLMDESLSSFNADAFKEYFKMMKGVKTTNPQELKLLSDIMWKTAVQTKAAMYTGE